MTTPYEVPTGVTRWAIVFAATLGSMVFDLSWIIVGVALPYMQGTFSTTPDEIAWVMTAFIVGGTLMTAATGWASTRFGRKRLFVMAIAANMVTTLMCGLADTLYAEVFWRFVQGDVQRSLAGARSGDHSRRIPRGKTRLRNRVVDRVHGGRGSGRSIARGLHGRDL